jgi:hypothetical protein
MIQNLVIGHKLYASICVIPITQNFVRHKIHSYDTKGFYLCRTTPRSAIQHQIESLLCICVVRHRFSWWTQKLMLLYPNRLFSTFKNFLKLFQLFSTFFNFFQLFSPFSTFFQLFAGVVEVFDRRSWVRCRHRSGCDVRGAGRKMAATKAARHGY